VFLFSPFFSSHPRDEGDAAIPSRRGPLCNRIRAARVHACVHACVRAARSPRRGRRITCPRHMSTPDIPLGSPRSSDSVIRAPGRVSPEQVAGTGARVRGFFRFLPRLPVSERGLSPRKLGGKRLRAGYSPRADLIASLSGKFFLRIDTILVYIRQVLRHPR